MEDKVKAENPTLTVKDFRFMSMYLQDDPEVKMHVQPEDSVHEDGHGESEEAEAQVEAMSLKVFLVKLKHETDMYDEFLAREKDWTDRARVTQRQRLLEYKRIVQTAANNYCDGNFPIIAFEREAALSAKVGEIQVTWQEAHLIPRQKMFTVYYCNMSVLGCAWPASLAKCARVIADALNHNPGCTCAIIIAPNAGSRGGKYLEDHVEEGQADVERELRKEDFGMVCKRANLAFEDTDEGNASFRAGYHPM